MQHGSLCAGMVVGSGHARWLASGGPCVQAWQTRMLHLLMLELAHDLALVGEELKLSGLLQRPWLHSLHCYLNLAPIWLAEQAHIHCTQTGTV